MGFLDLLSSWVSSDKDTSENNTNPDVNMQFASSECPKAIINLYDCYNQNIRNIKDTKKAELFFSSYDAALQSIKELCFYEGRYSFYKPTPKQEYLKLKDEFNSLTRKFLMRKWNSVLQSANKLKTEKGKQNHIEKFFVELQPYFDRLSNDHIELLEKMKREQKEFAYPKISIQCGKYLLSTIEDIQKISIAERDMAYNLQRAATDFKRNNQLDYAIACLRKSNELSDYEDKPSLMQKDYFRLVKYLEYDGQTELAAIESEEIFRRHPEFLDKRISNLPEIKKEIIKNKEFKNDLVFVNTNNSCPICRPYNRKIFSISGKSKLYPILPEEISKKGGFCPDCIIGVCSYFEGISTPPTDIQTSTNRKKKICPHCRQDVINIAVICPKCHYDFLNASPPKAP